MSPVSSPSRITSVQPLWAVEGGQVVIVGEGFPVDPPVQELEPVGAADRQHQADDEGEDRVAGRVVPDRQRAGRRRLHQADAAARGRLGGDQVQLFDLLYALMGTGNPAINQTQSLVYLFFAHQQTGDNGYAAAVGVAILVLVGAFTMLQFRMQKRWVNYV